MNCRRGKRRDVGYTLIEMLTTIAALVIVLGLMVSLAHHVRSASADVLTRDILRRLDLAMSAYIARFNGNLPDIPPLVAEGEPMPTEAGLRAAAEINDEAYVHVLKSAGLMTNRFGDLSVWNYDEVRVLDAWGSPIPFVSGLHPSFGMTPRGWFFFSAGPDRQYLTREDNLESYDPLSMQP